MPRDNRIFRRVLLAVSTLPLLLLSACGGSARSSTTPTLSVEEIFTSAVQTFDAQQATVIALTPPTVAPSPTLIPTLPPAEPIATISFDTPIPATSTGGSAPGCDNAAWIADVTIPDGSKMEPSQSFKKTWTLHNSGSCTWEDTYQLAFVSGDKMSGASVYVAVPVPPGQEMNVTVDLSAPADYGDYKGIWQMQNAQGQFFGSQIWVSIKVRIPDNNTATPTP